MRERGFYRQPQVFNQPEERGLEWARHPEMMRQLKEKRLKQMEETKRKKRKPTSTDLVLLRSVKSN